MNLSVEVLKEMRIEDFLGRSFSCGCGKEHRVAIEKVLIENNALDKLREILHSFGYQKVHLVADTHTYAAAGARIEQLLQQEGFYCSLQVFRRPEELVPDEAAIGELLIGMPRDVEVILAVGSGVINDLCKYMSWRWEIPYIVFATAASMDGYASDVAALTVGNLKTTLSAVMPKAIVADIEILKKAPSEMAAAGIGDMLGKYSALNDWKLGHRILGEYYCEVVADMVRISLDKCVRSAGGLHNGEDGAFKDLMEGLVISGIAMSYAGNSRPASGAEHHLSHFWEMMFQFEGKKAVLHGWKVGIGTLIINRMRKALAGKTPDFEAIRNSLGNFDTEKWTEDVQRFYRGAASGVLELNRRERMNSEEARSTRLKKLEENWSSVATVLEEVPDTEAIKALLTEAGAPVHPSEIGIGRELTEAAVVYAKELRARYTILQLLWDLGCLEEFSKA